MDTTRATLLARLAQLMEQLLLSTYPPFGEEWVGTDLTIAQLRTLALVHRRQAPLRMSEFAAQMAVSLSSATGLVERLVGKGLVERGHDLSDRRVVTFHLTPRGNEEAERFLRLGHLRRQAVAEALTEAELQTVVEALEVLVEALKRRASGESGAGEPIARGKAEAAGAY